MLGVDIVLPDFTYIEKNRDRIQGIVITHGHEDHIGALPYLLKQINLPVYGARLTLALVDSKLKEHGLSGKVKLNVVEPGGVVQFGAVSVEFIPVNHSIPDACALGIKTPAGYVVHTGDFKIDCTPITGSMIDLARFGALGTEGVLALLADSTNAERPRLYPERAGGGRELRQSLQKGGKQADHHCHLLLQPPPHPADYGCGGQGRAQGCRFRPEYAQLCGDRDGARLSARAGRGAHRHRPHQPVPKGQDDHHYHWQPGRAHVALTRMAFSEHRKVEVGPDDYIIISATPIPGNEKTVGRWSTS